MNNFHAKVFPMTCCSNSIRTRICSRNDFNPSVEFFGDFRCTGITCEKHDGGKGEQGKEYFLHNAYQNAALAEKFQSQK